MPSTKRKAVPVDKAPIIKFKLDSNTATRRKRARYNEERREEVKLMRHTRACLRCSLLRIKCSNTELCTACSNLVLHAHAQRTLSFSGCIRTRLDEVGFFDVYIPQGTIRESVLAKAHTLAPAVISLQSPSSVTCELKVLIDDFDTWLYDPMDSVTCKVIILSSAKFSELISTSVEDHQRTNFQRMICAESLAYSQAVALDKDFLSIPELRQIGAMAGQQVLKYLDNRMKPQSLKGCSYADLQALFFLVFGTILAICCTATDDSELSEYNTEYSSSDLQQIIAQRSHLGQILAHHMVFLGSQLKLPTAGNAEQFLLENALRR